MDDVLKGNFETQRRVQIDATTEAETLEERFEREALKRLGGSIAFVKKRKVLWDLETEGDGAQP